MNSPNSHYAVPGRGVCKTDSYGPARKSRIRCAGTVKRAAGTEEKSMLRGTRTQGKALARERQSAPTFFLAAADFFFSIPPNTPFGSRVSGLIKKI